MGLQIVMIQLSMKKFFTVKKQLICVLRAILDISNIVILDELTNIVAISENKLQNILDEILQNNTA